MYYKIFDLQNNKELDPRFFSKMEAVEVAEDLQLTNYNVFQVVPCKGCSSEESYEQFDAHGISTGYWCNPCYNSSKYPYRKDYYPTLETHNYGEKLED